MAPPSWAYQVELFTPPPDEELICSICRCVFCEPMECPCQHAFCKSCIVRWLNVHRNCPICRKRTSETQLRSVIPLLNNMIMKLNLHCHNKDAGCDASFMLEACETHLKVCLYELVECSLGCGKLVFRKDITNHKTVECPFRFTKCDNCKLKIYQPWDDHNCVSALQAALKDLEKERDELKKEVESLKSELRDMSKRSRSNHQDSDLSSLDGIWSSCSNSSGFSTNHVVRIHSDTDDSNDSDTSAYMEDAVEPEIADYHLVAQDDPLNNDDDHTEEDMNESNRDSLSFSIEQSVGRILQSLSANRHDIENDLSNNDEAVGASTFRLEDAANGGDDRETRQNESNEAPNYENDSLQIASAPPESTIVIGSSSSDNSDNEHAEATSTRRSNLKRRFASPNSFARNCDDDDAGSRKNQRSSSNECSNDDAEVSNVINDNVAAYALCSATEQEAVPSTSTGFVAGSFSSLPSRRKTGKNKSSNRQHKHSTEKKDKAAANTRDKIKSVVKVCAKPTSAQAASERIFESTLSLFEQEAIESDPDWMPSFRPSVLISSSSSNSSSTSSSNTSSRSTPLDFLSSSASYISEPTESDSSYELEVPPTTYDLLERYSACDNGSEDSDSDYVPS